MKGVRTDYQQWSDSGARDNEDEGTADRHYPIPVYVRDRPANRRPAERVPVRTVIRRNNKLVDALSTPWISLYNARSLWSKLKNFSVDMDMRRTDLCFH